MLAAKITGALLGIALVLGVIGELMEPALSKQTFNLLAIPVLAVGVAAAVYVVRRLVRAERERQVTDPSE